MSYVYEFLVFNGINCLDYGVRISGSGTYAKPKRATEVVTVPGRNGTLEIDQKRYENIPITYSAFIVEKFDPNYEGFAAYMLAQKGYKRLEDTYHPDRFRLARYTGGLTPAMSTRNRAGEFEIAFDCKPQFYLKDGERVTELTNPQNVKNPTLYEAKPIFKVYGAGTLTVGSVGITVTASNGYTILDCDAAEAYDGTGSRNKYVQNVNSYDYPSLLPGENAISWSGFSKVELTPRWWTL